MNAQEVAQLLGICSALDPKIPQPDADVVRAWYAVLDDVPSDQAGHIVRFYYRSERYLTSREPISPADIVQAWNARRRPSERERAGENRATRRELPRPAFDPEVIHRGVDRVMAALATKRGLDQEAAESEAGARRLLRSVDCPHCKAPAGQPCVGYGGRPLTKRPAHPAREEAALTASRSTHA